MGNYLNPGNDMFYKMVHSEIYVDKTGLIGYCNHVINTMQRYICVSRPRRFGKSMAANMLSAYYSRECDSEKLFEGLEISKESGFKKHLNQYDTIFLNMQEFLSRTGDVDKLIDRIKKLVIRELKAEHPDVDYFDDTDLVESMQDIYREKKIPFVVIIDEWDCIFREYKQDKEAQEKYLDFLRDLLKDKGYIHLAYMTGILPIKKYGTHSALNMFDEFSMISPGPLASYVGFTETEVEALCRQYKADMSEVKSWYDGYSFEKEKSIYSPRSVVNCMRFEKIENYWKKKYEDCKSFISQGEDGDLGECWDFINKLTIELEKDINTSDIEKIASIVEEREKHVQGAASKLGTNLRNIEDTEDYIDTFRWEYRPTESQNRYPGTITMCVSYYISELFYNYIKWE